MAGQGSVEHVEEQVQEVFVVCLTVHPTLSLQLLKSFEEFKTHVKKECVEGTNHLSLLVRHPCFPHAGSGRRLLAAEEPCYSPANGCACVMFTSE
jgi:hypothetical protein